MELSRRELLAMAAVAGMPASKGRLGGSPTAFSVRARAARERGEQFDIVEHCHSLGLAGAESILRSTDADTVRAIRHQVDSYGMAVVLNIPLPKRASDVPAFENGVKACKDAGAIALHAALTGRRYEDFDSLEAFRAKFAECQESVALAEPVLRKYRLRLAVENHKGWRAHEQAAWLQRVSSEWVGVCLDTGNNISLCELPDETFAALTPFAIFSHLKDMGVEEYQEGFLLSEVPFGDGVIDLVRRVAQLRQHDPDMLFCLEMITRDPLRVPVFTDKYWITFSDAATEIPGRDVAKTLELVRLHPPRTPLPRPDGIPLQERVLVEDKYNRACIAYSRRNLNL